MLLVKIKLKNFRQYKNAEILFPQDGLIGVLGLNGAGKSTLFNAIQWCLYGKIKDVTSAMIKNQSAGKKEECYVEMDFVYEGKYYRIHRNMVSSKCFALVWEIIDASGEEDCRSLAVGVTSLNQTVEEDIFKMDHRAFCTCYYAEQDDFDALVKLNPGPRVQTMTKLLRIETIDEAAKKVREDYRSLENEVKESEKHLKDEVAIAEQKEQERAKIDAKKLRTGEIIGQVKELKESYADLSMKREEGEKDSRKHRDLLGMKKNHEDQIETLSRVLVDEKTRLSRLQTDKETYEEIKGYKEIYNSLSKKKEEMTDLRAKFAEKKRIEHDMDEMKKKIQSYAEEYASLKEKISIIGDIESEIETKETLEKSIRTEIEYLRTQLQEVNADRKTKGERFKELEGMKQSSTCPTCKRPFETHTEEELHHIESDMKSLIEEAKSLKEKADEYDGQIKEKETALTDVLKQTEELRRKKDEKSKYVGRFEAIKTEVEERKTSYKTLENSLESVKHVEFNEEEFTALSKEAVEANSFREKAISIEKTIEEIPSVTERVNGLEKDIESQKSLLEKAIQEITLLNFDEEAYAQLSKQIEEILNQVNLLRDEHGKIEGDIREIEMIIKSLDEKLEENKKIIESIAESRKRMVLLAKLDEAFKAYKIDKLSKLAPALSDIMSDMLDRITNGKYDKVELDDQYNISIYRQGVKNSLEFYSGGEQKLAALCQRLAISNLLVQQTGQANFDMLAMDEVFGAMDTERQDMIMEMLRNLNEMFPQILIVTHSEFLKENFDHVLQIKQNKEGNSEAIWETEWDDTEVRTLVEAHQIEEELEEAKA